MTRKRFVKLLMAEGVQRNEANEIARESSDPYSERYERRVHLWFSDNFKGICLNIQKLVDAFGDGLVYIADAASRAFTDFMASMSQLRDVEKE